MTVSFVVLDMALYVAYGKIFTLNSTSHAISIVNLLGNQVYFAVIPSSFNTARIISLHDLYKGK